DLDVCSVGRRGGAVGYWPADFLLQLAASVRHPRSGGSRLVRVLLSLVPRYPRRKAAVQRRGTGADPRGPTLLEGGAGRAVPPSRSLAPALPQPEYLGAVPSLVLRQLRMVLLSHLAASLPQR